MYLFSGTFIMEVEEAVIQAVVDFSRSDMAADPRGVEAAVEGPPVGVADASRWHVPVPATSV